MNDDLVFRLLMVLPLAVGLPLRAYYQGRGFRTAGPATLRESPGNLAGQGLFTGLGLTALAGYVFYPPALAWTDLAWPAWLRWVGAGLALASLPLLAWTHFCLGAFFSPFLCLRRRHRLVSTGPYRWVRHPLYCIFYLVLLAWFLLSASWLLGLLALGMAVTVARRVDREEAMLAVRFGRQYEEYARQTGRYLPRLKPSP